MVFSPPRPELEDRQLRLMLEKLIDCILRQREPPLQLSGLEREQLIELVMKMLLSKQSVFTRKEIINENFILNLTMAMTSILSLQHAKAPTDELMKTLKAEFSLLFKNKFGDQEYKLILEKVLKLSPLELKKFMEKNFTKEELNEFYLKLRPQFKGFAAALTQELEKFQQLKLSPENHQKQMDDMYVNLFGLINSAMTGTYEVPVYHWLGNGLGFNDWNPHHGEAQIDNQNNPNAPTDPLGAKQLIKENELSLSVKDFLSEVKDEFRHAGLTEGPSAPHPTA